MSVNNSFPPCIFLAYEHLFLQPNHHKNNLLPNEPPSVTINFPHDRPINFLNLYVYLSVSMNNLPSSSSPSSFFRTFYYTKIFLTGLNLKMCLCLYGDFQRSEMLNIENKKALTLNVFTVFFYFFIISHLILFCLCRLAVCK
jgi:hypothetical protein